MEPLLECPVCHENFDLLDALPRILKVCGHLICSSCLAGILNNQSRQPRCPLDNLELPNQNNLEEFPVCFLVKEILEKKAKKERCPKHNKKITFICFNDQEKLCSKCVEFHAKKHHEFTELDGLNVNVKEKTDETRQKIKEFVKDMTTFHKDIEKIIDEKRQQYTNDVHEKFSQFKSLIDQREEEIISETDCYFESQKVIIRSLFGEDSELMRDLTEKKSKLARIFNYEDFLAYSQVFENINKQIDEWKLKINSKEIHKKFWGKLEQNNQEFCDKFTLGQNDFLSNTRSTGIWSNEYLINNIFMKPNNQIMNGLKIKSLLNIELFGDCLTITTANEQKEILIELNRWSQANEMKLILNKSLSKEDESLLDHIWQGSKTLKSLYFKFQSGTVSKSLSEIFRRGVFTFSSISIDIEGYDVAKYPEVLLLIKELLYKSSNLDYVDLKAPKASFPPQTRKNILLFDGKKMKHLKLDFRETNITDEDIENIFVPMPNLETFYLNMTGTKITDKALKICGKNTLSTTHELKSLTIFVGANLLITDYGIESVLENFVNLTTLMLYLDRTGITDKTIKLLSERMPNQFINLKAFGLDLGSTRVSDNSLSQFFQPMPKLEDLRLGFSVTAITDKTINNLVKNTLKSIAKPLSNFDFAVTRTNCTDMSISELLTNLNCDKYLYLRLGCEGVTDISIAPFIQKKFPTMRKIEKLVLKVCNTTVSQEIKDQISALEKRINKL